MPASNIKIGILASMGNLFCLAISIAMLVTANAKADYYLTAVEYLENTNTSMSDWAFESVSGNQNKWGFSVVNGTDAEEVKGTLTALNNIDGKYVAIEDGMLNFKGGGQTGTTTMTFNIDGLDGTFVNSFYMTFADWAGNLSGLSITVNGTYTETFSPTKEMDFFLGFVIPGADEYIQSITIAATAGSGSAAYGNVSVGLGALGLVAKDQPDATPEPTTLAIIGLGLAGLGVARARRRK